MAQLLLLEQIADRALRRERLYSDHLDLFAESDEFLIGRFRLPKPMQHTGASTEEPDQTLQPSATTRPGAVRIGIFSHWDIPEGAGRQGGHFTAIYQP